MGHPAGSSRRGLGIRFSIKGEAHGASTLPVTNCAIGGSAFRFGWWFSWGTNSAQGAQDHDEERVGFRRSYQSSVSLSAWAGARGSWTRGAVFPAGGGSWTDAKDARQR